MVFFGIALILYVLRCLCVNKKSPLGGEGFSLSFYTKKIGFGLQFVHQQSCVERSLFRYRRLFKKVFDTEGTALFFVEVFEGREFVLPFHPNDKIDFIAARYLTPVKEILSLSKPSDIHATAVAALFVRILEGKPFFKQRRQQVFNCFCGKSITHRIPAPFVFMRLPQSRYSFAMTRGLYTTEAQRKNA